MDELITDNPFPDDEIQARIFQECMQDVERKYTALHNELYTGVNDDNYPSNSSLDT